MRKVLLIALILVGIPLASLASTPTDDSQAAAESSIAKENTYYIELIASYTMLNDNGQVYTEFGSLLPKALGINEKDLKKLYNSLNFKSTVDALNYWSAKGWSLVSTYSSSAGNGTKPRVHMVLMITGNPKDVLQTIMAR